MIVEELLVREEPGPDMFPRELRAFGGSGKHELAERAGSDRSTVSLLENGRHKPYPDTLRKLADALEALQGQGGI